MAIPTGLTLVTPTTSIVTGTGTTVSVPATSNAASTLYTLGQYQVPISVISGILEAASVSAINVGFLFAQAEQASAFYPNAVSLGSTAQGLFQITIGTFAQMVAQYGPQFGITTSDILDPRANAIMAALLNLQNQTYMQDIGLTVGVPELQLANLLGIAPASSLISAYIQSPTVPAYTVVPQNVVVQNQTIFYNKDGSSQTVQDVYQAVAASINARVASYMQLLSALINVSTIQPASSGTTLSAAALQELSSLTNVTNTVQNLDILNSLIVNAVGILGSQIVANVSAISEEALSAEVALLFDGLAGANATIELMYSTFGGIPAQVANILLNNDPAIALVNENVAAANAAITLLEAEVDSIITTSNTVILQAEIDAVNYNVTVQQGTIIDLTTSIGLVNANVAAIELDFNGAITGINTALLEAFLLLNANIAGSNTTIANYNAASNAALAAANAALAAAIATLNAELAATNAIISANTANFISAISLLNANVAGADATIATIALTSNTNSQAINLLNTNLTITNAAIILLTASVAGANATIATLAASSNVVAIAAEIVELNANVAGANASILSIQTAEASNAAALASSITLLNANVAGANATISTNEIAQVANGASLASSISLLNANVAGANATIAINQTTQASNNAATATSLSLLNANVGTLNATVLANQGAQVANGTALAFSINLLNSNVAGANATILTNQNTFSTANTALATSINLLNANVAGANATILTNQNTFATANTALATSINLLNANVAGANATILTNQNTFATANTALATSINLLNANVAGANATILTNQNTFATANTALVSSINLLNANVAGANATILTNQTTQATANTALASLITLLNSNVAGANATILTNNNTQVANNVSQATSITALTASVAGANATITANQSAQATTNTANANQFNQLSASVGASQSLNPNPMFANWGATTFPTGYNDQVNGAANTTKGVGTVSPYALTLAGVASASTYITSPNFPMTPGWYIMEADIILNSGSLISSGLYCNADNSSSVTEQSNYINFSVDPDINQTVQGAGTAGNGYHYAKLVQFTASSIANGYLYPMSHFNSLGTIPAATNSITFNRIAIRPASAAEVAGNAALPIATTAAAQIITNAAAAATANTAVAQLITSLSAVVHSNNNLLPYGNFENGLTGWTGWQTSANVSQNPTWGQIAYSGTATGTYYIGSTSVIPLSAATTYTISANLNISGAATGIAVGVNFLNSSQVYISGTAYTPEALNLSMSPPNYIQTFTTPALTAFGVVYLGFFGPAGTAGYAQRIMLEIGSVATAYDTAATTVASAAQITNNFSVQATENLALAAATTTVQSNLNSVSATVTANQSAQSTQNSSFASSITNVTAIARTGTNMLPYSNFEDGEVGWTGWGTGATVYNDPNFGWLAALGSISAATALQNNTRIPIQTGQIYTYSGNVQSSGGTSPSYYLAIQWFNSSNTFISQTNSASGTVTLNIGATGPNVIVTATAPAGTTNAICYIVIQAVTYPVTGYAQKLKFEQGSVASGWDGSATTALTTAAVTATATALTTLSGQAYSSYVLKSTAGNVITSMSLISSGGATPISLVAFQASTFAIYNGTSSIAPFTVSGGSVNMTNVVISGSLVSEGTITATQLAIGVSSTSIIQNPGFESGTMDGWIFGGGSSTTYSGITTVAASGGYGGAIWKPTTSDYGLIQSKAVPCTAGETYVLNAAILGASAESVGIYVRLEFGTAITAAGFLTGTETNGDTYSNGPVSTAWQTVGSVSSGTIVTVPSGYAYMSVFLYNYIGGPLWVVFDDIYLVRQSGTVEISNGAITAPQISVSQLSAISSNLGSITGGSLNIGSGAFQVNTSGQVTIQNATSGQRLVVTSSLIQVYDSTGTLRVQLGIW